MPGDPVLTLFTEDEMSGPLMTVADAKARYSQLDLSGEWHRQPVCACGDYIAQHRDEPPHACRFSSPSSPACRCRGYEYSAQKTEANRTAAARCAPPAGTREALAAASTGEVLPR